MNIERKWILAALGLGVVGLTLMNQGEDDQPQLSGPKKPGKAKKSIMQRYITAQRKADETKKNQYLRVGDKNIKVRPLSN